MVELGCSAKRGVCYNFGNSMGNFWWPVPAKNAKRIYLFCMSHGLCSQCRIFWKISSLTRFWIYQHWFFFSHTGPFFYGCFSRDLTFVSWTFWGFYWCFCWIIPVVISDAFSCIALASWSQMLFLLHVMHIYVLYSMDIWYMIFDIWYMIYGILFLLLHLPS